MLGLGLLEIIFVLILGLFLFGNRLPIVMGWLGKSYLEFKKEADSLDSNTLGR
ncbi:MAG: twin-arginine translocase TatA/TatE family subunit [Planctomycetia bacterium]|nr:twin-arginine translocase TatA/TatE family subunit [Planctomycetia bacterium]